MHSIQFTPQYMHIKDDQSSQLPSPSPKLKVHHCVFPSADFRSQISIQKQPGGLAKGSFEFGMNEVSSQRVAWMTSRRGGGALITDLQLAKAGCGLLPAASSILGAVKKHSTHSGSRHFPLGLIPSNLETRW